MKRLMCLLVIFVSCNKDKTSIESKANNTNEISSADSIKIANYWDKANKVGLYSVNRQKYLDSALQIKPDSAYLWQQKAMPLYKERKFSLGKPFLEKAVLFNPKKYLDYSGFMKCLFSKEYHESIVDLNKAKQDYGDNYVMDHTYNFYIALNYLQLNEFGKAQEYLQKSKEQQFKDFPKDLPEEACHYLDWFYMGVVEYELENYKQAIDHFNTSLKVYENFADAIYYKAICTYKTGEIDNAKELMELARLNSNNTINEDQVYYVIYPYQVFHRLGALSRNTSN